MPQEAVYLRDAGSCCPEHGSVSLDDSKKQEGGAVRMLEVSTCLSVILVEHQFLRNNTVQNTQIIRSGWVKEIILALYSMFICPRRVSSHMWGCSGQ